MNQQQISNPEFLTPMNLVPNNSGFPKIDSSNDMSKLPSVNFVFRRLSLAPEEKQNTTANAETQNIQNGAMLLTEINKEMGIIPQQ